MPYPKPLSEKSLEKLYKDAGLTNEARSFLYAFFAACANLYGMIALRHVWQIFGALKEAPNLRRKDLLAFTSIVRREEQPYYVFELDEIFDEDTHGELDRHIVSRELVGIGYGQFSLLYDLKEQIADRPYCVPDEFLSYAAPVQSAEESALLTFLSGLTSTTIV
ncbi:MAG: hypothetical protein J5602_11260 [Clostridia bacterium]|nr:hypothetical protein [Clostridia bacterium]